MNENAGKTPTPISSEIILSPEELAEKKRLRRIEIARKAGQANKGKKSARTLAKLQTAAAARERILVAADKLINAQMIQAVGTHRMVVVTVDKDDKRHIETVRDEARMQNLLDEGKYGEDYLILEGSKPDWKAAQSLLDRAFGKAAQQVSVTHEAGFSLVALAKKRKALEPIKPIYSLPERVTDVSAIELDKP